MPSIRIVVIYPFRSLICPSALHSWLKRFVSVIYSSRGHGRWTHTYIRGVIHPVIFWRANYPGRSALDALAAVAVSPSTPLQRCITHSCTEEVASSRTYLEPPRRIKARPTGLRLKRYISRRVVSLASTRSRVEARGLCTWPRIKLHTGARTFQGRLRYDRGTRAQV